MKITVGQIIRFAGVFFKAPIVIVVTILALMSFIYTGCFFTFTKAPPLEGLAHAALLGWGCLLWSGLLLFLSYLLGFLICRYWKHCWKKAKDGP